MAIIVKRCAFTGCRRYVKSGMCAEHKRHVNRTYGYAHRKTRPTVFEDSGWRCFYCGEPVTESDDVAHLSRTRPLSPEEARVAPKVAAHRRCHNAHAPHLTH